MSGSRPLSQAELHGIIWHTQQLIDDCKREIAKLSSMPHATRPDWLNNQLLYWRHARAALEWSLNIAQQRKLKTERTNNGTI